LPDFISLFLEAKKLKNNNRSEISPRSEISLDTGSGFSQILGSGSDRKTQKTHSCRSRLRYSGSGLTSGKWCPTCYEMAPDKL